MICDIYVSVFDSVVQNCWTVTFLEVVLGCYCSSDSVTEKQIETDHTQVCVRIHECRNMV